VTRASGAARGPRALRPSPTRPPDADLAPAPPPHPRAAAPRLQVGLGMNSGQPDDFSQQRRPEYMTQIAGFINAVQYLRLPLVAVNIVVVVLKLLIG